MSIPQQPLAVKSTTKATPKKPVQEGLAIESANRTLSKVYLGTYQNDSFSNFYTKNDGLVQEFKQLGNKYKFQVEVIPSGDPWLEDTHIVKGDNTRIKTASNSGRPYEGGNILTLTNKKGENISLIGENDLLDLGDGDKTAGLQKASKLLNVPVERLISLPQPEGMYFHIDGLMTGLRNGVVGLNSPKLMLEALKAVDTSKLSKLEQLLLKSHISSTKKELQEHQNTYDEIEQTLKKNGFDVEPLPAYSDAGDWREATLLLRHGSSTEKEREDLLKNPYIKAFVEEYGNVPMEPSLEQEYKGEEYKSNPLKLQLARALYHVSKKFNSRILFANGIGGVDDKKNGYFISNGDLTFPSLNKAFETSILKNSKLNGIKNVELLKHHYPNGTGGLQCLTNEIGTPEQK